MKIYLWLSVLAGCLALLIAAEPVQAQVFYGRPVYGGYSGYGWYAPSGYSGGWYSGTPYYGGWTYGSYRPYWGYSYNPIYYSSPSYYASPGYANYRNDANASSYQSFYQSPNPGTNQASVRVIVPTADAVVRLQGQVMPQTGLERVITSPPLEPGWDYAYKVRASWTQDGRAVEREKTVTFRAGQQVVADFTSEALPR
jgi:uncharacterized protein (TIGR03000 family)